MEVEVEVEMEVEVEAVAEVVAAVLFQRKKEVESIAKRAKAF